MSAWTWVLAALCIVGALAALASLVPVVLTALRLRAKATDIKRRPLFLSLELLGIQQARLTKIARDARPVVQRAQSAVASIKESTRNSGLAESRDALERAGADLQALYDDLR
jgi:hypothetical protein